MKFGVWLATSSHVILAEVVHSVADFANQVECSNPMLTPLLE